MTKTDKELIADEGKYLHIVGTDAYFTRCFLTSTMPDIEEVDNAPE